MGLIVFVSIHVPQNSHSDWWNGLWVHHCGDECCTPQQSLTIVVLCRIHALMLMSNVSVERSATGARQVSLITAWHQQQPTQSRATGRNYTFAQVSILYFHNISTPTNNHQKKICKEQIKIQHWFATKLWPVSDSFKFKMEFRTKLEGQRMAAYLERERRQ